MIVDEQIRNEFYSLCVISFLYESTASGHLILSASNESMMRVNIILWEEPGTTHHSKFDPRFAYMAEAAAWEGVKGANKIAVAWRDYRYGSHTLSYDEGYN